MTPTSTYREHPPPPALAAHFLCVWSQVVGPGEQPLSHRVLPDGCADLVWIGAAPPVVAGPATRPTLITLAPRTRVLGLRLRPGVVPRVLGLPASDLLDRDTPLADLPRALRPVGAAPSLAAAQAALLGRLADAGPPDPLMAAATAWLARHPAGRIEALARRLEIGERRLHRHFVAAIGYGPKTFQRVLRLQRLLALGGRSTAGLAQLAAEAGYADQAHMSREVRALTGRSPTALLPGTASTLALSDLFKTAAEVPA